MLTLTASQLNSLDQAAAQRFRRRMVQHLERHFPEQCSLLSRSEITLHLGRHIDTATALGITQKRDICRYLNIVVTLGVLAATLETHNWAQRIISDTSLSVRARLLLLDRMLEKRLCRNDNAHA